MEGPREFGPFAIALARPEPPDVSYLQAPIGGRFTHMPAGCILHGSRSGSSSNTTHEEFVGTASWAQNNPDGLGWNATIGDHEICTHMMADQWGHNARAASDNYLAVEFAQPTIGDPISDGQVEAFAWWWLNEVEERWPGIARYFPSHAEVEDQGETGANDGKLRFPSGDARADDLRARIMAWL